MLPSNLSHILLLPVLPVSPVVRLRFVSTSMSSTLQIQTIVSMPFQENTYIVWRSDRADALVVDPGLDPDAILEFLEERRRSSQPSFSTRMGTPTTLAATRR